VMVRHQRQAGLPIEIPDFVELAGPRPHRPAAARRPPISTRKRNFETGLTVAVPPFIKNGDRIRIDTRPVNTSSRQVCKDPLPGRGVGERSTPSPPPCGERVAGGRVRGLVFPSPRRAGRGWPEAG
jgi:hypothetical protein